MALDAPDGRTLRIRANNDGLLVLWGHDVAAVGDRGIVAAAFTPDGRLLGHWEFTLDETPGVELPPTPFVLRGEMPCHVLRPGEPADLTTILADGRAWATVEGTGKAVVTLQTDAPPSTWQLWPANGASKRRSIFSIAIDHRSVRGTRVVQVRDATGAVARDGDARHGRRHRCSPVSSSIPNGLPPGALEVERPAR